MTTTPALDPELDLVLTREVNAPREILYMCWTTPEHLVHWFVPKPHKVTACDLDVRVGGRCNTTFEVEGNEMQNNGVYLEVVPNEKLVFTDAYTEGWKPAPEPFMTAILLLADAPDGADLEYVCVIAFADPASAPPEPLLPPSLIEIVRVSLAGGVSVLIR